MPTPRSVILKLTRANECLLEIQSELSYYLNSKPHRLEVEVQQHVDGSHYFIIPKWILESPPPERISALVGDCVHNMRSALDHLACALVEDFTGNPCPIGPGGTQFPVYDRATNDKGNPRVVEVKGGVSNRALTLIRNLQPYNRTPKFPESDPLAIVSNLDNADKHHSINIVAAYQRGGRLDVTGSDGSQINVPLHPCPLVDGETMMQPFRVDGAYRPVVEMQGEGTIGIALEPGPWGDENLSELLERLLHHVSEKVIRPLAETRQNVV